MPGWGWGVPYIHIWLRVMSSPGLVLTGNHRPSLPEQVTVIVREDVSGLCHIWTPRRQGTCVTCILEALQTQNKAGPALWSMENPTRSHEARRSLRGTEAGRHGRNPSSCRLLTEHRHFLVTSFPRRHVSNFPFGEKSHGGCRMLSRLFSTED